MAYLQARSAIARSGVTYAGLAAVSVQIVINGSTNTTILGVDGSFTIRKSLSQQSSLNAVMKGATPVVGNDLKILYRTPDDYLFGGTILRATVRPQGGGATAQPPWTIQAQDYLWLMDRFALVSGRFASMGINTALRRILAAYTDGGFTVGSCASSLGDLDETGLTFTNERVSGCIQRLAQQAGAYWTLDATKRVSIVATVVDGNALTLGNSTDARRLVYTEDLAQIRNSTTVVGQSAPALETAPAGATTLLVPSAAAFSTTGGTIQVGGQTITYSGVVTTVDPVTGNEVAQLTGLTIPEDIPVGAVIKPLTSSEDAAAQADLAARLGGGLSGVVQNVFEDPTAGQGATEDLAASDVERFMGSSPLLSLEYDIRNPFYEPGKVITASVTAPIAISGSFLIQEVEITRVGPNNLNFRVQASQVSVDLVSLLADVLVRAGLAG
jgi:hypothetical protein